MRPCRGAPTPYEPASPLVFSRFGFERSPLCTATLVAVTATRRGSTERLVERLLRRVTTGA